MTLHQQNKLSVSPVDPTDWPIALRILFARFPEQEQAARLDATMQAVTAGRLKLDGLRWTRQHGLPVGASLVMEQPDGISLVWPPIVTCAADDADSVEASLLQEVTRQLDQSPAKLGQMLLDPDEAADLSVYRAHGFTLETELFFVARSLAEPIPEGDLRGLELESFDETHNADRFAAVIEATYQGSLDCRVLDGLRGGWEAIHSHKLSGEWDPAWWRLFRVKDEDAGVLLLNDHPDQDAVELVYFGVVPAHRGKNIGRVLMEQALVLAAGRGRSVLFAAVDAKNGYANSLYSALGFSELARRTALFRRPGGLARQ